MRFLPKLPDYDTGEGFEIFLEADFLEDWLKFFLILLITSFVIFFEALSFLVCFYKTFFLGAAFLIVAVILDSLVLLSNTKVFFTVTLEPSSASFELAPCPFFFSKLWESRSCCLFYISSSPFLPFSVLMISATGYTLVVDLLINSYFLKTSGSPSLSDKLNRLSRAQPFFPDETMLSIINVAICLFFWEFWAF